MESYEDLVEAGKRAVQSESDAKWVIGDLALTVEKDYRNHPLEQYAEDIDVEYVTLRSYRATAKAWPQSARDPIKSWTVHAELNGRNDRFELIEQVHSSTEVRRRIGRRPSHSGTQLPLEDRVEQVKEALENPEIADAVLNDPKTRSTLSGAIQSHHHKVAEESQSRQRNAHPEEFDVHQFISAIDHLNQARREASQGLDELRHIEITDERRPAIRKAIAELGMVVDWASSLIESGNVSFEEELNELLRRGY